ncbi:hypothetical protein AB0I60_33395 [Actinosynnema sp. NPDC050436]|uniref:hypothetical protein n=1 Tax=Actinosynnema sp. NPDC050436 TaxID=3155659 RepID=UPI0033DBE8AC
MARLAVVAGPLVAGTALLRTALRDHLAAAERFRDRFTALPVPSSEPVVPACLGPTLRSLPV